MNIPVQYLKSKNTFYYLKKYLSLPGLDKSQYILISDFKKLYELKGFIRKATDQYIFIVLTADYLMNVFKSYSKSSDDILEFFSRLCGSKTVLMIPDYDNLQSDTHFHHLEKYLISTKHIIHLK